jgi:hypothetical protein
MDAMVALRTPGAPPVTVHDVDYVFEGADMLFTKLLAALSG